MAEKYIPDSNADIEDLSGTLSRKEISIIKCWKRK